VWAKRRGWLTEKQTGWLMVRQKEWPMGRPKDLSLAKRTALLMGWLKGTQTDLLTGTPSGYLSAFV
jgi:hypothetical protein